MSFHAYVILKGSINTIIDATIFFRDSINAPSYAYVTLKYAISKLFYATFLF